MKYILFLLTIILVFNLAATLKKGQITYYKFKATIRLYQYELTQILRSPDKATNVPMYLKVKRTNKNIIFELILFLTDAEAKEMGLEFIVHQFEDSTMKAYALEFHYSNSFLATFYEPSDDDLGNGIFTNLNDINTNFNPKEQKMCNEFEAKFKIKTDNFNSNTHKDIRKRSWDLKMEHLIGALDVLSKKPDINNFHYAVTLLYLTSSKSFKKPLNKFVQEINNFTVNLATKFDTSEFKHSDNSLYSLDSEVITELFFIDVQGVNPFLYFDEFIDNLSKKLISIVNTEFLKFGNFKYYGLETLFSKYMFDKYLNIVKRTKLQNVMLVFAQEFFTEQFKSLIYNPNGFISCERKKKLFNDLVEIYKAHDFPLFEKDDDDLKEHVSNINFDITDDDSDEGPENASHSTDSVDIVADITKENKIKRNFKNAAKKIRKALGKNFKDKSITLKEAPIRGVEFLYYKIKFEKILNHNLGNLINNLFPLINNPQYNKDLDHGFISVSKLDFKDGEDDVKIQKGCNYDYAQFDNTSFEHVGVEESHLLNSPNSE
jgi:hypothetical protein